MHLQKLKIRNFRALEEIDVEFDNKVSVIVGPNAAGKTTVLEAIRLLKAMLAPRTQNEAAQVIQSLGASSPHIPNQLRLQAIARDVQKPTVIGCHFQLNSQELELLLPAVDTIASSIVQAQVGQAFAAPGALIGFISSPQGQLMFGDAKARIEKEIAEVKKTSTCYLELTLSQGSGASSTGNAEQLQFFSFLERRLPPYKTAFTYFPADRALPAGEQPVQLGGADSAQQMESYNSQPQTKFNRLKNTIFSAAILGENVPAGGGLESQFKDIFEGILKGRELLQFGVNEIGLLSVLIRETDSGRTFDLDGMSSGEKGLILTFLLIARSVVDGGMVLLDEPELHLNPAVCKDLLTYLIEHYVRPRNLQILVCSHSPEILAGAFDSDHCSLYHLVSKDILTKVRAQDEVILSDALQRLGSSASENLLYKGVIFVEGPDDIAMLEAGFVALLRRYKLKFATGRNEIVKAVREIQAAESRGAKPTVTYFIIDEDDSPTDLVSSDAARVLQWNRRCLENYLIDFDVLTNIFMDESITKNPLKNQAEVKRMLQEVAFKQIEEFAARNVYATLEFKGLGIRRNDIPGKSLDDIADILSKRVIEARDQLMKIDPSNWASEYKNAVLIESKRIRSEWEISWVEKCDGKRFFEDLLKQITITMNIKKFKIFLMKEIALNESESWKVMESSLRKLVSIGEF